MSSNSRAVVCSVAGSDSGGGAGLQADLLSFAACGVHGATVVTAVTAQDTVTVHRVEPVSLDTVVAQIDAVAADLQPAAWKTGMLPTPEIVAVVAQRLEHHGVSRLVVDPVVRASSGRDLASAAAMVTLREALLPLALVVTPNLPEAEALTGQPVSTADEIRAAARAIAAMGPPVVVITGGHASGDEVIDTVYDAGENTFVALSHARVAGPDRHGTGCTFSAALAAFLARGADPVDAAASASAFVVSALRRAPEGIGRGSGPLAHLDAGAGAPLVRAPRAVAG